MIISGKFFKRFILTIILIMTSCTLTLSATASGVQSLQTDISKALDLTIDFKDFIGMHKGSLEEALVLSNIEYVQNDTVLAVAISENTLFSIMCDGVDNTCSGFTILFIGSTEYDIESCLKNLECSRISDKVWQYKEVLCSLGTIDAGGILAVTESSYGYGGANTSKDEQLPKVKEVKVENSSINPVETERITEKLTESTVETETETEFHISAPLDSVAIVQSDYEMEITDAGYSISDGYLFYSFIIENNSDKVAYQFPVVKISARNAEGDLIGTWEQTLMEVQPESKVAFSSQGCSLSEFPSKVEFELFVDDYNVVPLTKLQHPFSKELEIKGVQEKDDFMGGVVYLGEVFNPNEYDIDSAAVSIIFRNNEGSMIGGTNCYVNGIKSGNSATFEFSYIPDFRTEHYEISAIPW